MYLKILALLLANYFFLIRLPDASTSPVALTSLLSPLYSKVTRTGSSVEMNHSCINSSAQLCTQDRDVASTATEIPILEVDTVHGKEAAENYGEGRSFSRSVPRLVYAAARKSSHRPASYRQHPLYRAQERYQPSEVGYKQKRPSSQPEIAQLRPYSSPISFEQNTGNIPSQPLTSYQPERPKMTAPLDSYMPKPTQMGSEESDTSPPDFYTDSEDYSNKGQPPPKDPAKDQYPPSKYPSYHDSDENPLHDHPHDDMYLDYDPTSHEHNPDAHDHIHYDHSYYHAPTLNYTYQPPPANDTYQPMQQMSGQDEKRNKNPYSYYYIGRKLWYIPLYFSVYFIIYITSLLVKSIARHKITYPINYWAGYARSLGSEFNKIQLELTTEKITKALVTTERRYR